MATLIGIIIAIAFGAGIGYQIGKSKGSTPSTKTGGSARTGRPDRNQNRT